jgi:hypothetical protein
MHQSVYVLRKEYLLHLNHFQKWKPGENKPDFFSKPSTISSWQTKQFTRADDGSSTRNRNDAGSPERTTEITEDRRTRREEPRRRGGGKEERNQKNEDEERCKSVEAKRTRVVPTKANIS